MYDTQEGGQAAGTVTVGLAVPAEHEAAVSVWRESNTARRGGRPVSADDERRVRDYLTQPESFLLVGRDGGEVVGVALGLQGRADDGAGPLVPGLCHIALVFVAPDRWGRGIGGRLVDAVLTEARARGYDRTQLWTHADNRRAQRLYLSRRFVPSGRQRDDELGERIVHFTRPLP